MRYFISLVWVLAVLQISCGGDDASDSGRTPAAGPPAGPSPTGTASPNEAPGQRGENLRAFFTALEGSWSGSGTATDFEASPPTEQTLQVTTSAVRENENSWVLAGEVVTADETSALLRADFEIQGDTLTADFGQIDVLEATATQLVYQLTNEEGTIQTTRMQLVSPTQLTEEDTFTRNGEVTARSRFNLSKQ